MKRIIGIIGFGNMGSSIANQVKDEFKIICFDKDPSKLKNLTSIEVVNNIVDLILRSEVIILAVKPQDFEELLGEIKNCKHLQDKLFISIAAGISTSFIEKNLGVVRIVRAMPNLPLQIGKGITCLSRGKFASSEDFDFAEDLFEYAGEVLELPESMINAATAISGSGPGWFFEKVACNNEAWKNKREALVSDFIVDLKEAARQLGFDDEQAEALSKMTVVGSEVLLLKSGKPAAELRDKVTSRGGTTEAGLKVLRNNGSLSDAAKAALKRAEELSKE